jgi:hypothetical protein
MAPQPDRPVIVTIGPKSVGLAMMLAAIFGPIGMFYTTIGGALVMTTVALFVALYTVGLGLLFTWAACIIWTASAASRHNRMLGFRPKMRFWSAL